MTVGLKEVFEYFPLGQAEKYEAGVVGDASQMQDRLGTFKCLS